ncbi:MAG TPA: prepilin-type N-terminal cleavage/methylation domain-containing protein [Candidatus Saccharimonadia bacterium]|nr:prepilin-type N-terminal cleavage/methylation domain-containing protein [Candidatus Saccharimonadia bacterium]
MKTNLLKNKDGFTIIEVLIVLAIAAVILLVVFLAVPGLQRSQRNTAAKTDATHIATAIVNFITQNNNVTPKVFTDATAINGDVGTLSQLTMKAGPTATAPPPNAAPGTWFITDASAAALNVQKGTNFEVFIDSDAACGAVTYGTTLTPVATAAQVGDVALFYTTQSTGTDANWNCINAQNTQ